MRTRINSRDTYYRIRTKANGQRERLTLTAGGRIIEVTPIGQTAKKTRTGKRLAQKRNRLARRRGRRR